MLGFATDDGPAAAAAALVYVTWRSREPGKLKITPDIWAQVERWTRSAAKRASSPAEFVDRLKRRVECRTLKPQHCDLEGNGGDGRQFLVGVLGEREPVLAGEILRRLYRETGLVVALVRERLEREKANDNGGVA